MLRKQPQTLGLRRSRFAQTASLRMQTSDLQSLPCASHVLGRSAHLPEMFTSEPESESPSLPKNAGRRRGNGMFPVGLFKSGIGLALNSFLHCLAVQRAHFFDFLR